ncbi:AraC family transcriptional regulator [Amphibacillus indicireducens]|uniref:AraC family transcriptional regulator n=1 Tax=Amphibacillus indicireducens TaxID=1076330 RepID=A0ABP7V6Y0_9BACI
MNQTIELKSNKSFDLDHSVFTSPNNVNTHIHDCYELFYYISGDLTYYIEGHAYQLEPHDLIITNTRELHRVVFNSNSSYERKYIHFKSDYLSAYQTEDYNLLNYIENRKLGHHNKIAAKDVLEQGIDQLWAKIEEAYLAETPESAVLTKTYFIQMLIKINEIFSKSNNKFAEKYKYDEKTIRLLDYLNHNLAKHISLDLLEEKFYANKYYLSHTFKRITGFTVMEYVTYKRIIWAMDLLVMDNPALDVAHTVGFNDYSTFYKAFKKITGTSPRKYLKRN